MNEIENYFQRIAMREISNVNYHIRYNLPIKWSLCYTILKLSTIFKAMFMHFDKLFAFSMY